VDCNCHEAKILPLQFLEKQKKRKISNSKP